MNIFHILVTFTIFAVCAHGAHARTKRQFSKSAGDCWPLPCDFEANLAQATGGRGPPNYPGFGGPGFPPSPDGSGSPWGQPAAAQQQVLAAQQQAQAARQQAAAARQQAAAARQQASAAAQQSRWAAGGNRFGPGGNAGPDNVMGDVNYGAGGVEYNANNAGGTGSVGFGQSNVGFIDSAKGANEFGSMGNFGGSSWNFQSQAIQGNGQVTTEDRSVGPFTGVNIGSNVILQLTQSTPTGKVRLEGESNVLPQLDVSVQPNGVLNILPKPNVNFGNRLPVKAYASASTINVLKAMGASQILLATLNSNAVSATLMGASKLEITSGRVTSCTVQAMGQSQVSTFGLDAGYVDAQAMGSSVIQLTASKSLRASAMGGSQIFYRGSPQLGPITQLGGSTVSRSA